jgi:hypothetical protein
MRYGLEKDSPRLTAFDLFVGLSSAALGLAAGAAYFVALRINVELYVAPGGGIWRPILLHAARLIAIAIVFAALATHGAWPLLAGLLGFLGARLVASRKRSEPS